VSEIFGQVSEKTKMQVNPGSTLGLPA